MADKVRLQERKRGWIKIVVVQGGEIFRQVAHNPWMGRKIVEFENLLALAEEALSKDPALPVDSKVF